MDADPSGHHRHAADNAHEVVASRGPARRKLTPPRSHGPVVGRDRLQALVNRAATVPMTVVAAPSGALHFDVIPQTLAVTSLGSLRAGDGVNLEHAATPTTFLGGHVVLGHVDGLAEVVEVRIGDGDAERANRKINHAADYGPANR